MMHPSTGNSECQHLTNLHKLKRVMSQKTDREEGRGKNTAVVSVYKYNTQRDREIRNEIEESIKHYQKLCVNEEYMFKYRPYQKDIIDKGTEVLKKHGFLFLSMEVRTGKTLTSMGIANAMGCKEVLFLTKKKAISSINADYVTLNPSYNLTVINYESIHKLEISKCDLIVLDESHGLGAFPKPSNRAKDVKNLIAKFNPYVILLSGTPTPESYSQMYHQVYAIPANPFREYTNFYAFAKDYVKVKQKKIGSMYINDYSDGSQSILDAMKPMTIAYSQKEAGFVNKIEEEVLYVEMKPITYDLAHRLKKDLVVEGKEETILADTSVKLMQKLHQIYSGTVIFESGKSMVLDTMKAEFIRDKFKGKKIGIFYKFKEELNAIRQVFEKECLTDNVEVFDTTDCQVIALQIQSGREGISLRKADALVYYNIDFSATSYWQSRDRMTTKERRHSKIYWIFSVGGIEDDIYKAVTKKKDYTVNHFKKDLLSL